MAYTDFQFYQKVYLGTMISEKGTFCQAAERASDYLDMVTFGRLFDSIPEEYAEQVKRCCCALAEAVYSYQPGAADVSDSNGKKPKTQESIDAYSVSYASAGSTISALLDGSEVGLETLLHSICMRYLGRTGLLYRGCC